MALKNERTNELIIESKREILNAINGEEFKRLKKVEEEEKRLSDLLSSLYGFLNMKIKYVRNEYNDKYVLTISKDIIIDLESDGTPVIGDTLKKLFLSNIIEPNDMAKLNQELTTLYEIKNKN